MKYQVEVEKRYVATATYIIEAESEDQAWRAGEDAEYFDIKPDHVSDMELEDDVVVTVEEVDTGVQETIVSVKEIN